MERNIRAIMDAGGSISHHHGVGKLRKYFVDRVASPETVDAVKSLKHAVDRAERVRGLQQDLRQLGVHPYALPGEHRDPPPPLQPKPQI